jgi:hypothetical protein
MERYKGTGTYLAYMERNDEIDMVTYLSKMDCNDRRKALILHDKQYKNTIFRHFPTI